MDGLKLEKWRADFATQVKSLEIEFNAFFVNKKPEGFYEIKIDEESQNLSLEIKHHEELPKEIEKRLFEILYKTQPEVSV